MNIQKANKAFAAGHLMCGMLLVLASFEAASQEMKENICQAEHVEDCPTMEDSSMIQTNVVRQRSHIRGLEETNNAEHEKRAQAHAEVRIEKHGAHELRILRNSPADAGNRTRWILLNEDGCNDSFIDALTGSCKAEGITVNSTGHPGAGGSCHVVLEGTTEEIKQELTDCHKIIGSSRMVVETDGEMKIPEDETPDENPALLEEASSTPWGLDRIDQRDLPLSASYSTVADGAGVHVYVIDTGIYTSHHDFGGRAMAAWDFRNGGTVCEPSSTDCAQDENGHGTHCAATVGGTTYGVAKKVTLHAVKVFGATGGAPTSRIINAIDWVETQHTTHSKPFILSMSLGGSASSAEDAAVTRATQSGAVVVAAAGNDNSNACYYSPARASTSITVGSTDMHDFRSSFSNYGSCVDMFAPGSSILSAWHTGPDSAKTISGTSMACPHVSGALALLVGLNPTMSPDALKQTLQQDLTVNRVSNSGWGSPNKMLHVD